MKIPNEEHLQFLETLLERTKCGVLIWRHIMSEASVNALVFPDYDINDNGCFSCALMDKNESAIVYIARTAGSGETLLSVKVEGSADGFIVLEPQSSHAWALTLRLFHAVYERFPPVEKNIRSFLSKYLKSDRL